MGNIILLSAGLDSTVNLAECVRRERENLAITFDYGQKAAKKEIEFSKKICNYYKVKHITLKIPYYKKFFKNSLLNKEIKIPVIKLKDLNNKEKLLSSQKKVWIPNRNALFINIAACIAESLKIRYIFLGFNKEEAETFPDNSENFLKAINRALSYSTLNKVMVKSYTLSFTKEEILKRAIELNVPLQYLWVCYDSGKNFCWKCESCIRFKNALKNLERS